MRLRVWELALQSRILRVHISSTLCMRYNNVDGINSINLRFSRAQHSLKGVCYETSDFMKKEKKTLPIAPAFHGNNLLNYKGDSDILLIEPGKYLRTTVWDCSTKPGWERYHNVHLRGIEKIGFNVQFPIFETATNHSDYINIAAQFGHLTTLVFFMEDEKHLTKLGCLEDLVCLFHIDRNLVSFSCLQSLTISGDAILIQALSRFLPTTTNSLHSTQDSSMPSDGSRLPSVCTKKRRTPTGRHLRSSSWLWNRTLIRVLLVELDLPARRRELSFLLRCTPLVLSIGLLERNHFDRFYILIDRW